MDLPQTDPLTFDRKVGALVRHVANTGLFLWARPGLGPCSTSTHAEGGPSGANQRLTRELAKSQAVVETMGKTALLMLPWVVERA